jgi:hypothetical protein
VVVAEVHFHVLHHLPVRLWSALYNGLVLLRAEVWQLPHERDHVPKKFIIVCHASCRHASELNAVFHNPEFFRRGQVGSAPKFGCSRIKTTTDFCALHARREVTSAAHLCVLSGAGRYAPLVVQIGWNDDGSRANRD